MGRVKAEDLKVEGFVDFAGMDLTDGTGTEMERAINAFPGPIATKKRRNGRIHWKERAEQANERVIHWQVLCFLCSCLCFIAGSMAGFLAGFYFF